MIELLLVALLCEGHVLIEDVPGVGKTTLARAVARSIGGEFRRIQFTPDLLPTDITGVTYLQPEGGRVRVPAGPGVRQRRPRRRDQPRHAADAVRAAGSDGRAHGDGRWRDDAAAAPFLVLATENPIELEGHVPAAGGATRPLPRPPDGRLSNPRAEEDAILARFRAGHPLAELAAVVAPDELAAAILAVRETYVSDEIRHYMTALVRASREHEAIELGASPRGSLALFRAAQALAALRGRGAVLPDDVKELVPTVLSHRLILAPEAHLRGRNAAGILAEIMARTPVPVEGESAAEETAAVGRSPVER